MASDDPDSNTCQVAAHVGLYGVRPWLLKWSLVGCFSSCDALSSVFRGHKTPCLVGVLTFVQVFVCPAGWSICQHALVCVCIFQTCDVAFH